MACDISFFNVLPAIAQGRQFDASYTQPEKKVRAKFLFSNQFIQILMSGVMIRASTSMSLFPPSRWMRFCSTARRTLACAHGLRSPISSRKMVPV